MDTVPFIPRKLRLLCLTTGLFALSGCGVSTLSLATPATSATLPPPTISVNTANNATHVALDTPIIVTAKGGVVTDVSLTPTSQSQPVTGHDTANDIWTSTGALQPTTTYVLQAVAASPSGSVATTTETFTTLTPPKRLLTVTEPSNNVTVGVGTVISLNFNTSIPASLQQNLLSHITIETSTPVVGAWHWVTPWQVHWRPQNFWTTGTQVKIVANLDGVFAGNGFYGLGNWTDFFTIGPQHITYVNLTPGIDQATVYNNGVLTYTIPVSGGQPPTYDTIAGTLVVTAQAPSVFMSSESTFGIPAYAPGGYAEDVYLDNEISTDGYYMHWAPWNYDVGIKNTSHGCINIESHTFATDFYNFTKVGDLVIVQAIPGQTTPATFSDGEGDWQLSFAQYPNDGETDMTTASL